MRPPPSTAYSRSLTATAVHQPVIPAMSGGQSIIGLRACFPKFEGTALANMGFRTQNITPSSPTLDTPVEFREITTSATFSFVFGELAVNGGGVDSLCFESAQVPRCVECNRTWFTKDEMATFVPFRIGETILVASIHHAGRGIFFRPFDCTTVWRGNGGMRIVIPLLP